MYDIMWVQHCGPSNYVRDESEDDDDDDDGDENNDDDDDDDGAKTRYDICGIPPPLISPQFG